MNLPIRRLALVSATLSWALLTGCTLGVNNAPGTPTNTPLGTIQGKAYGGNQPIVGASIYVYAANTTGYGQASKLLSSTVPVTDSNGFFSLSGDYTCTAGQQVYLYALGGNTGAGTNSASGMLAVLGTCPASGTMASVTPYVWMNEVTTVAAAYAFSGFATDATHVSDDEGVGTNTTATLAQTGMANAFANAGNLANVATGAAYTVPPNATPSIVSGTTTYFTTAPQQAVDTVADILAACVNTASSVSSPSNACNTLLNTATSDGTATGVVPTDTATAAINMAHNPSANVATLYGLIAGAPAFLPYTTSQPSDFTLSILFPQGGTGTQGIAADGVGNIFFTYGGGNLLIEVTPAGVITSTTVTAPRHLAIDSNNNVWVPYTSTSTTSYNTIYEFSNNLTPATGSPFASYDGTAAVLSLSSIAIASDGSIWAVGSNSSNANKAIHLNSSGVYQNEITGLPKLSGADLAINPSGVLAITGATAANSLYLYSGTTVGATPTAIATATTGAMNDPDGVTSDAAGNFWVANDKSNIVSVISAAGTAVSTNGYTTSGTNLVTGDFDGLGNYFVGSSSTGIYELNSSGTQVAVYTPPTSSNQYFAVDPSGNLWYGGTHCVGEMIGIAAPKVTPIATATFNGKLATRP